MSKVKNIFVTVSLVLLASDAFANQGDFCAGFKEGYKTINGENVMVPMCPMAPMTPMGSTDYREGVKAGMRAAGK